MADSVFKTAMRTSPLPTWMPSANVDAQAAHVGWGAFIILAGSLALSPPWYLGMILAWLILLVWIGLKEWVFDLGIEKDTLEGSGTDSLFYVIGGVVGALTFLMV